MSDKLTDDGMEGAMLSAIFHVGIDNRDLAILAGKAWVQMKAERDAAVEALKAMARNLERVREGV